MKVRTVGAFLGAAIAAGWTLIALLSGAASALIVAPAILVAALLGGLLAPGVARRTAHKAAIALAVGTVLGWAPLAAIAAVTGWGNPPPAPYTRDVAALSFLILLLYGLPALAAALPSSYLWAAANTSHGSRGLKLTQYRRTL